MPENRFHTNDTQFLFQKLAHGDETAYTALFHLFTPRLIPYMVKITRDEQLAKELLQETFLKLWTNRLDLLQVREPTAWLFRIAANNCYMYLRTQANRLKILDQLPNIDTENHDVAQYAEGKELQNIIRKAIEKLPQRRRQIFQMKTEEGYSIQQISEALGISAQTVKNEIGIARKSVHIYLQKDLGIFAALLLLLSDC